MKLKSLWLIISGAALVSAGVFLWLGNFDVAFVLATLGLVAWFLNYRAQLIDGNVETKSGDDNDREDSGN